MNIQYNCNCDKWTKFFITQVLEDAKVEPIDISIDSVDSRRIHIHAKIWNENAVPSVIGMRKGKWEEHTWAIKYEMEKPDKFNTTLHYLLYDWEAGQKYQKELSSGITLYHFIPKPIYEGTYEIVTTDTTVSFTPIIYRN